MIKKILVTGATGQQGSATVKELLAHKFQVRALSRNITSSASKALETLGAELIEGDWSDLNSIRPALQDVDAVYMVLPPVWNMSTEEDNKEADLGISFVNMVYDAGINFLIYSSVMMADKHKSFRPRFKHTIEDYIWSIGLKATVLRPATFMENLLMPTSGLAEEKLYNFMPVGKKVPYISTEDIGVFARVVFQNPTKYEGKTLEIAGDILDERQILATLEKGLGKKIELVQLTREMLTNQNPLFGELIDLFAREEFPKIDFDELIKLNSGLRTFEKWLNEFGRNRLEKINTTED